MRSGDEIKVLWLERFGQLLVRAEEWEPLTRVREWVGEGDVRRSEVLAAFGEPSLRVGSRIFCYAPADGSGWVFFDCAPDELVQRYVPGKGKYENEPRAEDPLVRNVRIPAEKFDDRLVLTLYGRVQRSGVGWWIYHPL